MLPDRLSDDVDEMLVLKRLRKKVHSPRLHGTHGHRDVAMTRDEDDRQVDARLIESALKVEPERPGADGAGVDAPGFPPRENFPVVR